MLKYAHADFICVWVGNMLVHANLQADSGIRSRSSAQTGSDQKFNFGDFLKGDLPKKLAIMLVRKANCKLMLYWRPKQVQPLQLGIRRRCWE